MKPPTGPFTSLEHTAHGFPIPSFQLRVTAPEETRPDLASLSSEQTSGPSDVASVMDGCGVPGWWCSGAASGFSSARSLVGTSPALVSRHSVAVNLVSLVPDLQRADVCEGTGGHAWVPAFGRGGSWADTGTRPREGEKVQVVVMVVTGAWVLFVQQLPSLFCW